MRWTETNKYCHQIVMIKNMATEEDRKNYMQMIDDYNRKLTSSKELLRIASDRKREGMSDVIYQLEITGLYLELIN